MLAVLLLLHLLAAVIWVGGMFFAYVILRPAAAAGLEAPPRLRLWHRVLGSFFVWVWAAVVLLPATGTAMIFHLFGGFAHSPLYVHVMLMLGSLMILIFAHVYFAPWRHLARAVAREDWPEGGRRLAQIRRLVAANLGLGLAVIATAGAGRYLV
ncbi:MAG TPA: hypothetical protein ENK48_01945 [Gammaproteobacteria bacterium]|nr:hypothetical protein [Gammaproteobacteria bacterium]